MLRPIALLLTAALLVVPMPVRCDEELTSWEHAPTEYVAPPGLVPGAAFIDLIQPMPVDQPLRSDVWGGANVKPRNVANGLEDPDWSYWCMTVFPQDGKIHMFATRWPEDGPKGHMSWPQSSVVHATADQPTGPFRILREIGPGHNVMHYQTKDGTHVLYAIGRAYTSRSVDGPWTPFDLRYDTRGFPPVVMSNHTYAMREDGSYLMISRGGHSWISEDGLKPYRKINTQTPYPPVKGNFEDPVVWRDEIQYHMIVNDWFGRTAFHLRSRDGVDWICDHGKAYDTSVARNADGTAERWYKFERPNVLQDRFGRATHLYLAVIDSRKDLDKGNDEHSSKIIALPLLVERRIEIADHGPITPATTAIRVRIKAEPGFHAASAIDIPSLRFGSPAEVDFGRGLQPVASETAGDDLVVTFGNGQHGLVPDDFAGKLLGRDKAGKLLLGWTRLPGQPRHTPILSPSHPVLEGSSAIAVTVENFGLAASLPVRMKVVLMAGSGETKAKEVTVAVPALEPRAKADIKVPVGSDWLPKGKPCAIDLVLPSPTGAPLVVKAELTKP